VIGVGCSDDGGGLEEGSIRLEPADDQAPDPFVDQDLVVDDPTGQVLEPGAVVAEAAPPELTERVATGLSGQVTSGSQAGLYGGSQSAAICDVAGQIEFLTDPANEDRARAWAEVQGIGVDDIPELLGELTPVQLRYDTRVTNHGFVDGEAQPYQSILQAGTAILVDRQGVPRSRCSCGNPVTEPEPLEGEADDAEAFDLDNLAANPGDAWDGLDPAEVVTVEAGDELEVVVVTDPQTGQHVERLPGVTYTLEQLQAALPTQDELHQPYENVDTCPAGTSPEEIEMSAGRCEGPEGAAGFASLTAHSQGPEETWGTGNLLDIDPVIWTDAQARDRWLDEIRADRERFQGQFDHPALEPGDPGFEAEGADYQAGLRGDGTVEELELDGWQGDIAVATYRLVNPEGETSAPISDAKVLLARGNVTLSIVFTRPDDDRAAARETAEQYATQVIESL
jgi:hypothetical protein